jgi:hypothetical protein
MSEGEGEREREKLRALQDFEIPRDIVEEDWVLPENLDDGNVEGKVVVFLLADLIEEYAYTDKEWLEVNLKDDKVCISREGICYEPHFIGIIKELKER